MSVRPRLLAISEQRKSGLILCKAHHAEFAGPGAIVATPVEQEYTAIIAIGSPEIVEVSTYEARQKAYSRRIQWIRWLQKMTDHPDPVQRTERVLSSFEAFFGRSMLLELSDEVLALLVGVLPQTVATVRSHQTALQHLGEVEFLAHYRTPEAPVLSLAPDALEVFSRLPLPFTVSAGFVDERFLAIDAPLPCIA